VLHRLQAGRIVERTGHDSDIASMIRTPKKAGTTQVTEAALCFRRRSIPAQTIVEDHVQVPRVASGSRYVMATGSAALFAVTVNDGPQGSGHFVSDATAQAGAARASYLLR